MKRCSVIRKELLHAVIRDYRLKPKRRADPSGFAGKVEAGELNRKINGLITQYWDADCIEGPRPKTSGDREVPQETRSRVLDKERMR